MRDGTYFLVEKLRAICQRRFVQLVHLARNRHLGPDANAQSLARLPVASLTQASQIVAYPMDADAVECMLVNLIFQGKIRGVLSHRQRLLALSKDNAYPNLAGAG